MIDIEVAYGTDKKQFLQQLAVEEGTTAREAVLHAPLVIFGKQVADDTVLRQHDRVELYRPLLIDPKEARRRRVSDGGRNKIKR